MIWLAAQDVKAELSGHDVYQYGDLAALVGVNKTNWSQNYVEHYDAMTRLYKTLTHNPCSMFRDLVHNKSC